jgi:resuscitation-promoting factor RpfB
VSRLRYRRRSPLERYVRRMVRQHPVTTAAAVAAGLALGIGAHAAGVVPLPAGPSSAGGNVALGQRLAAADGWGTGQQWDCLYDLWQRESGWSVTATNQQSGAYGIPQSLPPSKMPAAALPPDNGANAQIGWGLAYISGRYGDPCTAWDHEIADGWY